MPSCPMAPPPAMTDHVGLNVTMLPDTSFPTAVNCCLGVTASVTGVGTTVIVASAPGITVIDAWPEMVPTDATTVLANSPGTVPAVNTPDDAIVPPLAATDHVGVMFM